MMANEGMLKDSTNRRDGLEPWRVSRGLLEPWRLEEYLAKRWREDEERRLEMAQPRPEEFVKA